jgi:hypothetical protein
MTCTGDRGGDRARAAQEAVHHPHGATVAVPFVPRPEWRHMVPKGSIGLGEHRQRVLAAEPTVVERAGIFNLKICVRHID